MTYEEAEICFEKGFPVVCVRCPGRDCNFMVGQTYYINAVSKFIPYGINGKGIEASATLKQNERECYSVKLGCIEPLNSFNIQVQKFLKNRKTALFKDLIREYLAAGITQTRIIEKVKSIIKESKTKEKQTND